METRKIKLGRLRRRWEENIKRDCMRSEDGKWTELAQDCVQRMPLV
jgi:hypothetical protein